MALSLLDANDSLGKHANSWYAATANKFDEVPPAKGKLSFDVAIVGAGFSGLSSALHLAESGFKVCVLDAHRVGWGASGRNGGQVGTGQRLEQDALEKKIGESLARRAFDIGLEATQLVRDLIKCHKIKCAYKDGIIEAAHRSRFDDELREHVEFMHEKYNHTSMRFLPKEEMREKVGSPDFSAGILDTYVGHVHPLNYARGLAKAAMKSGAQIFEMSRVTSIEGGSPCTVKTADAEISATHVILAANGYLGDLDKRVANHVMPINNFIAATEPLDEATARSLIRDGEAVHDTRFVVNYFRLSADNRMLFGGGENYSYKFPSDIVKTVRKPMLEVYPQLKDVKIDYAWGGTLAITMERLPHFEFRKNGIVNISGYSGSGIHMATMSGKLAAEAINGQMAKFDIMRSLPSPKFPGGATLRWPLLPLAMTWYALRDKL